MILDDILVYRRQQLEREKRALSLAQAERKAKETPSALDFAKAMSSPGLSIIAEVKKASPSKGVICQNFRPVETAAAYEKAGAQALSVLTEEHYFQGGNAVLERIRSAVSMPVLRKDFIFDPYQVIHARALGADAALFIVAMLDKKLLAELLSVAQEIGIQALVEVHDEAELDVALENDAAMIGMNNRNLKTFEVRFETSERLIRRIPADRIRVVESGITGVDHMVRAREMGADAVLIGETFMRSEDLNKTMRVLRGEA